MPSSEDILAEGLARLAEAIRLADQHRANESLDDFVAKQPTEHQEDVRLLLESEIGRVYGNRFRVAGRLGRGGMGVVFSAIDSKLDRQVALKVVAGWESGVREARNAAKLNHPHIVTVYDVGEAEDGCFIAQELISGGRTLEDEIVAGRERRATRRDRRRWNAYCLHTFAKLARALQYAHREMVVHLDIKPANVLVTKANEPIIADFGIARDVASAQRPGFAGTPGYMSPEQSMGRDPRGASDVFALGVSLQQSLTTVGAHDVAQREATPLPEPQSRHLANLCRKATQPSCKDRFPSMRAFAEAIERQVRWYRVSDPMLCAVALGIAMLAIVAFVSMGSNSWPERWRLARENAEFHWQLIEEACEDVRERRWDGGPPPYDFADNHAWNRNVDIRKDPMGGDRELTEALIGLAERNSAFEDMVIPASREHIVTRAKSGVSVGEAYVSREQDRQDQIDRTESHALEPPDEGLYLNSVAPSQRETALPDAFPRPWVDLRFANIEGVEFPVRAQFSGALATKANISICKIERANFVKAELEGAQIMGCPAWGADFSEANMRGVRTRSVDFGGTKFISTWLGGADLRECNFYRADLSWAVLPYAVFDHAVDLSESAWNHCFGFGASFVDSSFQKSGSGPATARYAYWRQADFRRATMTNMDLTGAVLTNANLEGASLSGAVLAKTWLDGARLHGADLRRTDLSQVAPGLTVDQLLIAVTDAHTVLPACWSEAQVVGFVRRR